MIHQIETRVREALREHIRSTYGVEVRVATDRPPKIEMGEIASPCCFELAKQLKRAPRQIAQEIAAGIAPIEGVARWEIAGGGYLNAFLDRSAFLVMAAVQSGREGISAAASGPKFIVEHTCINPNKAAHIGHVRNAVLGDTYANLLRYAGRRVEVQNYIDNTGVQVADVVVGFQHLENKSLADVRALIAAPRFDYYCWDLYARVTQWYDEDKTRGALRAAALKAIEQGHGDAAQIADLVSTEILRLHLKTLDRLEIEYDLLPRESEILHLHFWDMAFEFLKKRGAIELAASGKNAGCWVMRLGEGDEVAEDADADTKIIVRSNGTVTYVGKDIAYHLWKFGLLGKDFHYAPFHTHPSGHASWVTQTQSAAKDAPAFGQGTQLYNVIDTRQSYVQDVVNAGLRRLGYADQADHLVHFDYEIVALSPRCAHEMGYELSAEEAKKPYVEVSGRKGHGVKADDLIDRLEASARVEVDQRHPDVDAEKRSHIAHVIAVSALRYFLLKYTRNTIIAFDFKDALSFEGETGPYVQYAVVRAQNIFRKHSEQTEQSGEGAPALDLRSPAITTILKSPGGNDLWSLLLLAGSLSSAVDSAIGAQEPAFVAKYAFQLAQAFNGFYHTHHILSEEDPSKKAVLLLLSSIVHRQLVAALGLLGIEAPERM
ncbi:MAG: arginine--tRNA ligase [Acidobacteria bacterium]|nr:arginine--tRNA ligase [Acidobacteriota bacterium]